MKKNQVEQIVKNVENLGKKEPAAIARQRLSNANKKASKNHEKTFRRPRKFWISFFPVGDSQKSKRVFWKVYAWLGFFGESRDLVFSPSRSNLGLVSSRFAGFVRNREI